MPNTGRFAGRSTTDLLILLVAGTISISVLAAGATIAVVEVVSGGKADTSIVVAKLSDVINTMIGLLAGFIAGRTETKSQEAARREAATKDAETDA